jgi:hypothetical protein
MTSLHGTIVSSEKQLSIIDVCQLNIFSLVMMLSQTTISFFVHGQAEGWIDTKIHSTIGCHILAK